MGRNRDDATVFARTRNANGVVASGCVALQARRWLQATAHSCSQSPPSSSDLEVSGHSIAHELACRRPLAVMSRRALRPAILPPRSALGSNTRKHPIAHPHVQGDSRRRPATSIATTFVGLASGGAVTAAYMSEGARAGKCAVAQEQRRWRRLLLSACEFFHEDRGATQ